MRVLRAASIVALLVYSAGFASAEILPGGDQELEAIKSQTEFSINGCVANLWTGSTSPKIVDDAIREHLRLSARHLQITTPLMEAVSLNNIEHALHLIDSGVDLNETNDAGCTALIWAIALDRAPISDALIRSGADVNLSDAAGRTPLMIASRKKDFITLQLLIIRGAKVNRKQSGGFNEADSTALMYAARAPHNTNVIRYLVDRGATVDATDERGRTALMQAAWYGRLANTRALVRSGASINVTSRQGLTAHDYAVRTNHSNVAQYLRPDK